MPNLLGATPAGDRRDFARLFDEVDFRPDELKIYPCLLVESAELASHHARGEWRPYADDELADLLADCLERTPPDPAARRCARRQKASRRRSRVTASTTAPSVMKSRSP